MVCYISLCDFVRVFSLSVPTKFFFSLFCSPDVNKKMKNLITRNMWKINFFVFQTFFLIISYISLNNRFRENKTISADSFGSTDKKSIQNFRED